MIFFFFDKKKTIVNGTEYTVLARNESITGWVEVVEEIKPRNVRVMRAGHSLLGGIYRNTSDSIYGSFYFLEGKIKQKKKGLN